MNQKRRLQVSTAGIWYTGLTILLGLTALSSGNNIIYLIESLLLSGMILSGILSERTVSGVEVEIHQKQARAHEKTGDQLSIHNRRGHPLFCVEICEWQGKNLVPLGFVPMIQAKSTAVISSQQMIATRGVHHRDGIAIATSFPFNFARKIRLISLPQDRIVWPACLLDSPRITPPNSQIVARSIGNTVAEGEVRLMTPDDDFRLIVWPLSAKGLTPLVRIRRTEKPHVEALLDLRTLPGDEFEKSIQKIARDFYAHDSAHQKEFRESLEDRATLVIQDWNGKRKIRGFRPSLNELAQIKACGNSEAPPS